MPRNSRCGFGGIIEEGIYEPATAGKAVNKPHNTRDRRARSADIPVRSNLGATRSLENAVALELSDDAAGKKAGAP
jgi:hypothetical protein